MAICRHGLLSIVMSNTASKIIISRINYIFIRLFSFTSINIIRVLLHKSAAVNFDDFFFCSHSLIQNHI